MSLDFTEGRDGRTAAGRIARRLEPIRATLAGVERELWAVAVLALVGDLVLTVYGLEAGLTEANPVARAAVEQYGYAALAGLKVGAFSVGVLGWLVLPRRHGAVVPLALAIPWSFAVVVNVLMLTLAP